MINHQEKANNYVIYVRKSTDETGKQEKSIEDQIAFCKELAEKNDLNYSEIIQERKSAKTSGTREKFVNMIKGIEKGKYDGIIAWHPDRLARNMGDGGQIIEMVDCGVIKDLQFCTQQFSKDANGKMLLGLSFVLSKQYSDKLSDDVKRGNITRHKEGLAIGRTKHGYNVSDSGKYIKGQFWDLLNEAWQKRLQGNSEKSICEWLNKEGYSRQIKTPYKQRAKQFMSTTKLNRIFKDTFYYGHMCLHGEDVYLPDKYNFPAMITKEDFIKIQRSPSTRGSYIKKNLPLRGKVFDANIEGLEYKPQMISNKAKNKYLSYIVDTTHKKRLPLDQQLTIKSVRTLKIVTALDLIFQKINPKFTEKDYKNYITVSQRYIKEQRSDRENERARLKIIRGKVQSEHDNLVQNYLETGKSYDNIEIKAYKKTKIKLEKEIKKYSNTLSELEKDEANLAPSFENFLNTLKTLAASYKDFGGEQKLELAEMLVLNILVSNGEVHKIELQPPFDELFPENISLGWG